MNLEQLKSKFPLFTFALHENGNYSVKYGTTSRCFSKDTYSLEALTNWHALASTGQLLNWAYSNLRITVSSLSEGYVVNVWTLKDETGMVHPKLLLGNPDLHNQLTKLNTEARMASADGWFYCSGHGRAERKVGNEYCWFAGKYCEEYGLENPQHRKDAESETYN